MVRIGRDLARARGRKCRRPDRRASTGCRGVQIDIVRLRGSLRDDHYLWNGWFLTNRFWLLGPHEINATLEGHR